MTVTVTVTVTLTFPNPELDSNPEHDPNLTLT